MNTYNINDENFKNSEIYQNFIKENPSSGYLKIRAFTANQALPVKNLNIVVFKIIDDDNAIIFFEGVTNESGIIERIVLPAPKLNPDNLNAPNSTIYDITATYIPDNTSSAYKVNMYENIYAVQTINILPEANLTIGDI